ncbi:MAG: thioredoxin family protein [Phycisphaerales bacterium JB063]
MMTISLSRSLTAVAAASVLATSAFAGGENWHNNYEESLALAEENQQDVLLDFTGSDWCGWCIRLNEEVFSHDEFKTYAGENFVLVELDYPARKELPEDIVAQNEVLKEQFGIEGFPTIILADAQGRPYAQTGYQQGGPEAYVAHLEELKQKRVQRDEYLAAAEEAEGIERAQRLHDAMQVLGDDMAVKHYASVVDEIMTIDADNEAGLKGHYEAIALAEEQRAGLNALMSGDVQGDPQGTIDGIDAFLEDDALVPAIRQEALAMKSQIMMFVLEDQAGAKVVLEQAIAVDPDSQMGQMLQGALERFFGDDAE